MKHFIQSALASFAILCTPTLGISQDNKTWIVFESQSQNPSLCKAKGICGPQSQYITRLLETPSDQKAREMLGALDQIAKNQKRPVEHPDSPQICQKIEEMKVLGFNPQSWPTAEKLDALKGLSGVHFSVEAIQAPAGYDGPFGVKLQSEMEKLFEKAGLNVLTQEEMENTPGEPQLNIFFSPANQQTGCTYSVFSSLTQTMLLSRNHTTKLKVGTWGMSGGPSTDHPQADEYAAIIRVVESFLQDYLKAQTL